MNPSAIPLSRPQVTFLLLALIILLLIYDQSNNVVLESKPAAQTLMGEIAAETRAPESLLKDQSLAAVATPFPTAEPLATTTPTSVPLQDAPRSVPFGQTPRELMGLQARRVKLSDSIRVAHEERARAQLAGNEGPLRSQSEPKTKKQRPIRQPPPLDFVAVVKRPKCRSVAPHINASFWKSLPNYEKFATHHTKFVSTFLQAHDTASEVQRTTLLDELLAMSDELVESVTRPNSHPSAEGNGMYHFEREGVVRHCYSQLRGRIFQATNHPCWHSGRHHAMAFTTNLYQYLKKNTRPMVDPDFKPKHFIDVGAREYTMGTYPSESHPGVALESSSLYFMEKYYPGFDQMYVAAMEADPRRFQASYRKFFDKHKDFHFYPAAAWIHNDGINIGGGDMLSIRDSRGECTPTVDMAEYVRNAQELPIVMKIDIEGAEFQVVEHLHRHGLLDWFGEIFFECHGVFDDRNQRLFEYPDDRLTDRSRQLLRFFEGHGYDCLLIHDFLRSLGITTHLWP